jgi:hypothetical protein
LPVLPLKSTVSFFSFTKVKLPFLNFITKWEDQQQHPITQDYADMMGWEEMVQKAALTYHSLSAEQKKSAQIFADNYGEAGALHHFHKKYNIPDVVSLNSSFALWAPDNLDAKYIIYVDDDDNVEARLKPVVESYRKTGEVINPYAREKGTSIYLLINPSPKLNEIYKAELADKRLR